MSKTIQRIIFLILVILTIPFIVMGAVAALIYNAVMVGFMSMSNWMEDV